MAISFQSEIERIKKEKKAQLEVQYRGSIENEKTEVKERLQSKLKADKAEKIENETVRKYLIYFRPEDTNEKVKDLEKQIEAIDANYLTYDNRAEKAKIERQEKALNSILGGYVKNPFLPTYLFSPETLAQTVRDTTKEPEWCLESLNDRQKLAVRRALASESLFLLQGPPGTGKTQVIAEITAQLTKQGKKVLISSETHKAIDNVFERLPKIPEIRPLRLIPSQNGKETNYSPERLVDNFYLNISGNLEKQVKISSLSQKESEIEYAISDKQLEISEKKKRYEELGENEGIETYGELNSALKQKITRFFRDFDIVKEYDSDNLEEAFTIIAEEWRKLESGYKSTQQENKVKIPMYKEIVKYLSQEDILEEDRQSYTRELFNNVNVFGITCTSRDRFTKNQLQELDRYGIESVDIRTQGIDVVIIDEVSKSSFLDLLIPILYGKTVILVGDHRQLPPMYDLRHMRKDDFEGLDESIISKEINDG